MEKKKYPLTEEQKEKYKATKALKKANRSPEQIAEDKAYFKIAQAKCFAKRTPEKAAEVKAKAKIENAKWREENPNSSEKYEKTRKLKHDLGYYCVYLIENYNSLGDHYCGQTGNLYTRMKTHRQVGRMNTENHRVLGCFRTREQALAFEAIQHEAGYHGQNYKTIKHK